MKIHPSSTYSLGALASARQSFIVEIPDQLDKLISNKRLMQMDFISAANCDRLGGLPGVLI